MTGRSLFAMQKRIKRILVSQPEPTDPKSPYHQMSERYGLSLTFKPFFTIEPVTVREFRDQKINILDHTAIILSSRTVADHFFRMIHELRITMPDDMKYFCASEAVAVYLQKYITYRKRKIFSAPNGKSDELIQLVLKHPKENYFVPINEGFKEDLFNALESKKIRYTRSILYRTKYQSFSPEEIASYDLLVFFSPNGVASLKSNIPDYEQGEQLISCFGKGTKKALEEENLKIAVAAPTPEYPSMIAAIESLLQDSDAN